MANGLGAVGVIEGLNLLAKESDPDSYAERMDRRELLAIGTSTKKARETLEKNQLALERENRNVYNHKHTKIINEITNINKLTADNLLSDKVNTFAAVDNIETMFNENMAEVKERYKDNPDLLNVINRHQAITTNAFKLKKEGISMIDGLSDTYTDILGIRDPMFAGSYSGNEDALESIIKNIKTKQVSSDAIGNEALSKALTKLGDDATKTQFIKRKLDSLDVNKDEAGVQFADMGDDEAAYSAAQNLIGTVDELVRAGRIDDAYKILINHDAKEDADGRSMVSILDAMATTTNNALRVQTNYQIDQVKSAVQKVDGVDIIARYGIGKETDVFSTVKGDYLGAETDKKWSEALGREMDNILNMLNADDTEVQGIDLFNTSIKKSVEGLTDEGKLWALGGFIRQLDDRSWVWNTKGSNHMYKDADGNEVKSGKWGERGEMIFDSKMVGKSRSKLIEDVVLESEGDDVSKTKEMQTFNAIGKLVEENFRMKPYKKVDSTSDMGDLSSLAKKNSLSRHADTVYPLLKGSRDERTAQFTKYIKDNKITDEKEIVYIYKLLFDQKFAEGESYDLPSGE